MDVFEPAKRQIFKFNDGTKVVARDPLIIEGRLRIAAVGRGTTIDKVIAEANSGINATDDEAIAVSYQATELLGIIAAEVFGLKLAPEVAEMLGVQTEPGNADLAHCIGVLDHFYREMEKKNHSGDSPPASMQSTESISAIPQTTST